MGSLLLSLGLLYLLALGAGRLCARVHVPRVTGYLLVGVAGGPSVAGLLGFDPMISQAQLDTIGPIEDLALGLIVFVIGGHFELGSIRRFGPGLAAISAIEIGATALAVGVGALAVGAPLPVAAFLAIMAATTAPAATQMVVREYRSEGPLTDLVMTLIGLDNLAAIAAFILFFRGAVAPDSSAAGAALDLLAPLAIGAAAGVFLAVMDQRLASRIERQILGLASIAALSGGSSALGLSPMLACLAAGAALVNSSPHGRRLMRDLALVDYPLYVLFFVTAGADLQLELVPKMGVIGAVYIAGRAAGKWLGNWGGARAAPSVLSRRGRGWLGPAMMAQAGLAIGLASTLAREWGEPGRLVQTAVLASVVVFEGLGPLLTRIALVRAGEVTVLSLLSQRVPVGYAEGLHEVVGHFREALGLPRSTAMEKPSDIRVSHVMRKNVESISSDTPFDGILRTFGHSRYDRLPVLDAAGDLIGVVQYSDVAEVLFDPGLAQLVVASDIASQDHLLLCPDDTLETAMDQLRRHPDHTYLLVVERENPRKLAGVVRHNDVLSAQRQKRR